MPYFRVLAGSHTGPDKKRRVKGDIFEDDSDLVERFGEDHFAYSDGPDPEEKATGAKKKKKPVKRKGKSSAVITDDPIDHDNKKGVTDGDSDDI